MKQSPEGYILFAALIMMQICLLLGIYSLTSSQLALQSAYQHYQRMIALAGHPDKINASNRTLEKEVFNESSELIKK